MRRRKLVFRPDHLAEASTTTDAMALDPSPFVARKTHSYVNPVKTVVSTQLTLLHSRNSALARTAPLLSAMGALLAFDALSEALYLTRGMVFVSGARGRAPSRAPSAGPGSTCNRTTDVLCACSKRAAKVCLASSVCFKGIAVTFFAWECSNGCEGGVAPDDKRATTTTTAKTSGNSRIPWLGVRLKQCCV